MAASSASRPLSAQTLRARGGLPQHVAIIMDGNGRWAERRGVPRIWGHRAGRKSVRAVVKAAIELGIPTLTLYTFSAENWRRPKVEVRGLMQFLVRTLREEIDELDETGVSLRVLGRLEDLPADVRAVVRESVRRLAKNDKLLLQLALSYGGRQEILAAVEGILEEERQHRGALPVTEERFARHLWTAGVPDPDLLIRTSGEMRVSNFLLWQIAYTELWVTKVLWPDFRQRHFLQAVADYQRRKRRFGRVR